jgi:uncharacterized protein YndB with AHSA1/START domain
MMVLARCLSGLLLVGLLLSAAPARAETESFSLPPGIELSPAQSRALLQGEIVLQDNAGGNLGGTALGILNAPPWRVWQVVTDYPAYPAFFPRNIRTVVHRIDGDYVYLRSEYRGAVFQPIIRSESRVHHETRDPQRLVMTWTALRTNLKRNAGSWELRPWQEKTLVIYRADFNFNWIPDLFASSSAKEALGKNLDAVRRRLADPRYDQNPGAVTLIWAQDPALAHAP